MGGLWIRGRLVYRTDCSNDGSASPVPPSLGLCPPEAPTAVRSTPSARQRLTTDHINILFNIQNKNHLRRKVRHFIVIEWNEPKTRFRGESYQLSETKRWPLPSITIFPALVTFYKDDLSISLKDYLDIPYFLAQWIFLSLDTKTMDQDYLTQVEMEKFVGVNMNVNGRRVKNLNSHNILTLALEGWT